VRLAGGYRLRPEAIGIEELKTTGRVSVAVRPNDLQLILDKSTADDNEIEAVVENIIYLGDIYEIAMAGCGAEFALPLKGPVRVSKKQKLVVRMNHKAMRVWPA
jgi:ABC-type Fe3+/spermidine/putrescine transport system ATPase subunit